jgi:ABC-type multidrug transport system ATPase subunit
MAQVDYADEPGDDVVDSAPRREKAQIQLNWVNISIKAMPAQGRCKGQGALLEERTIIDDVSGAVLPGQFLAIIGASGAGKTTLLNFLSGREISANLVKTGVISVNGKDKDQLKNFSAYSAYVQQDDILF